MFGTSFHVECGSLVIIVEITNVYRSSKLLNEGNIISYINCSKQKQLGRNERGNNGRGTHHNGREFIDYNFVEDGWKSLCDRLPCSMKTSTLDFLSLAFLILCGCVELGIVLLFHTFLRESFIDFWMLSLSAFCLLITNFLYILIFQENFLSLFKALSTLNLITFIKKQLFLSLWLNAKWWKIKSLRQP